jgi:hypothetical protein
VVRDENGPDATIDFAKEKKNNDTAEGNSRANRVHFPNFNILIISEYV